VSEWPQRKEEPAGAPLQQGSEELQQGPEEPLWTSEELQQWGEALPRWVEEPGTSAGSLRWGELVQSLVRHAQQERLLQEMMQHTLARLLPDASGLVPRGCRRKPRSRSVPARAAALPRDPQLEAESLEWERQMQAFPLGPVAVELQLHDSRLETCGGPLAHQAELSLPEPVSPSPVSLAKVNPMAPSWVPRIEDLEAMQSDMIDVTGTVELEEPADLLEKHELTCADHNEQTPPSTALSPCGVASMSSGNESDASSDNGLDELAVAPPMRVERPWEYPLSRREKELRLMLLTDCSRAVAEQENRAMKHRRRATAGRFSCRTRSTRLSADSLHSALSRGSGCGTGIKVYGAKTTVA